MPSLDEGMFGKEAVPNEEEDNIIYIPILDTIQGLLKNKAVISEVCKPQYHQHNNAGN